MRLVISCVLLFTTFVLATTASAQTTKPTKPAKPRESADHLPLPDFTPVDRRVRAKIPLVASLIGSLPEEVTVNNGKWIAIDGPTETSASFKRLMDELQLGVMGIQFFANADLAGSQKVAIGLTNGRISRVVLITGRKLQYADATKKLLDYRLAATKVENGDNLPKLFGSLKRDNISFYARVAGEWQHDEPAKRSDIIGGGSTTIPGYTLTGPTALVFDVDAYDWFLIQHVRPEFLEAVKSQNIMNGMTEIEARLAMWTSACHTNKSGGDQFSLEWYRASWRADSSTVFGRTNAPAGVFFAGDFESGVNISVTVGRTWEGTRTATFTNGIVTQVN